MRKPLLRGRARQRADVPVCEGSGQDRPGAARSGQERVTITLTREQVKWLRDKCDDHLAGVEARQGTDREEEWDGEDYGMCIAIAEQVREVER